MKPLLIVSLSLVLVFAACKKYNELENVSSGTMYIYGRVFIKDSINDNGVVKPYTVGKLPVKLSYSTNQSTTLYSSETNSEGYFLFQNLGQGAYTITVEATAGTDKLIMTAKQDITLQSSINNVTLLLELDNARQNGLFFTTKDANGSDNIAAVEGCFFSSRQLWLADTCAGSSFTLTSNVNGAMLKTNVTPGNYYVHFRKTVAGQVLKAKDSITVSSLGISRRTVTLQ